MDALKRGVLAGLVFVSAVPAVTQQVSDSAFTPVINKPEYQAGLGPRVVIDAAHLNFHTAEGGYLPFAEAATP